MMQWWKRRNELSWHMEQTGMEIPLSEIALLPDSKLFKTRGLNDKVFKRTWNKYRKHLIPRSSLLSSFLAYPQFWDALLASNFENWKKAGLDKFFNLGNELDMFSEEVIINKLGHSPTNWLQYRHVLRWSIFKANT